MSNEEKPKGMFRIRNILIAALVLYLGYHVFVNVKYRMDPSAAAERSGNAALSELQSDADKFGIEEAQRRAQARSEEKLASLGDEQQAAAAAAGFLGLEYRFSEGYEVYCKQHGVDSMPNMRKYTLERNKDVHDKAVEILESLGASEEMVKQQMLEPIKAQLAQAIDMEMSALAEREGKDMKTLCIELDENAVDNEGLEIAAQSPAIVQIIENY